MARPSKAQSAPVDSLSQETHSEPQAQSRVYKGERELDHDLFKLLPTALTKNVGFQEDDPIWTTIEHSHIFHTIDSSGRAQDTTNAVGGHHHQVQVVKSPQGVPTLIVSGPLKWVVHRKGTRRIRTAVPMENDTHTHEVQYLGSEKIKARAINPEFAKLDAMVQAKKPSAVEGVFAK